jgi:GNAT superfamily N-acetyltransferase
MGMPITVRRATEDDAGELTRLRAEMLTAMGTDASSLAGEAWRAGTEAHFRERLADVERFAAFVAEAGGPGLVACAVGWLDRRLPSPINPSGDVGCVANMSTDPEWRGQGCGRATLTALLDWMRTRGVPRVDLLATDAGEPLYRSLGFTPPHLTALTLPLD